MTHDSLTLARLSDRIAAAEASLRRTRLALAATLLCVGVLALSAGWSSKTVEAEKVLFTDDVGTPVIVLRGVPGTPTPGLVLETPGGVEVLTLGPAMRQVR